MFITIVFDENKEKDIKSKYISTSNVNTFLEIAKIKNNYYKQLLILLISKSINRLIDFPNKREKSIKILILH